MSESARNLPSSTIRINLGCGNKRREGYVGLDRFPCDAADVLADLNERLPFCDNSIEEVWADNVVEHIPDLSAFMSEIHRVCRHDALVTLITPHFTSASSWRDPTHVHHLSYFSMHHFEKPSVAHYMRARFKVTRVKLSFGGGLGLLGRLICAISPRTYEEKWCFLMRASTLTFFLQVKKADQGADRLNTMS